MQTIDASGASEPSPALRPPPWGFWATLGWAVLAFGLGQLAGIAAAIGWIGRGAVQTVSIEDGVVVAITVIVSTPAVCSVVALAARLAGWPVGEYLGLVRFRGRDFLVGVLSLAGLVLTFSLLAALLGHPDTSKFQTEVYRTAAASGLLPLFMLAAIVLGPTGEELLFRGFLFRGWVRSDRSAAMVIVVTAIVWSALHVQYDWFFVLQVLAIGLVLGWLRWRSGSTSLTLLLHALINLAATVEVMFKSA
jgi:membrane protease YdiL (CAAX protease family)